MIAEDKKKSGTSKKCFGSSHKSATQYLVWRMLTSEYFTLYDLGTVEPWLVEQSL